MRPAFLATPTDDPFPWFEVRYDAATLRHVGRRPGHFDAAQAVAWLRAEKPGERWWLRQRNGVLVAFWAPVRERRRMFCVVRPEATDELSDPRSRLVTAYEPKRDEFEAVFQWPEHA